ncbi:replicative DNA helicase [Spiroplasma kunkelii CR2-3x]|uniref:Replicative DNA helicase n=2 Tax=Spiroplasma kunkelii TaxID=47834 RepID=A0A0K2JFF0_SPIKU|nr:replicative DNA helicase [Spiroplasma kunkelii]AAP58888.1 replicative DNA helicase [Spiroplasma kunkelii CR2-3x]ALA97157.1 replicative DNA helicase [Spiroplasma kunkelii CR2-3x]
MENINKTELNKLNVINDAEKNVLAIIAHSITAAEEVFSILTEEDFTVMNYKVIFKTLQEQFSAKVAINITTLSNYMLKNNILNKVGGIEFLTDLFQSYTTDVNLSEYLDIIIKNTTSRRLKAVVDSINRKINAHQPIDEVVSHAEKEILDVKKERKGNLFKTSYDEVDKVLQKIELLENSGEMLTGSPSGFRDLDGMTSGFQKGDFIILAARPSMGKTALALNFAVKSADQSKKAVAIFSVEMPAEQLIQRMLGSYSTVDSVKVRTGKGLKTRDWENITKAADFLKQTNLFIDDTPSLKVIELQSKLRKLCRENEVGLVVIDYLQLLSTGTNFGDSRQQEVSTISRQLKALARELEVPIICLSQLSRSVEKREDKRPIMSDLRDSGAIEQDADIIMFLFREEYYTSHDSNNMEGPMLETEKAQLILSKHRNGPTGSVELLFVKKHGSFADYGLQNRKI